MDHNISAAMRNCDVDDLKGGFLEVVFQPDPGRGLFSGFVLVSIGSLMGKCSDIFECCSNSF